MAALLPSTTRLLRPSRTIPRLLFSPTGPVAWLHQHGPSRSAVVHEQAIPQAQNQVPPVNSSSCPHKHGESGNLETLISRMPLVQSLRSPQSAYKESIPHLAIPPAIRQHHLVGGSLAGLGKLALAPYMWTSSTCASEPRAPDASSHPKASSVVSVFHIGRDLCGHPGFVHGGLLSVLFDEVFARCVSAAFPSGLGMTANLNVDFRKPALPDRLYVLRAETTKVEGRKAWVAGKMICLPLPVGSEAREVSDVGLLEEDSPGAVMVAEGKALFVEPKFASVSLLS
ncbi:hypothetical protein N7468_007345 [Penicillium chermesinum]|uniref:Thioesterase domain-containing protein n=1 Tax=Penicillium chermesinum TaxID=63820 RepID=A0A9W9NU60_9EURO|nr:uncharacterized protein N7468_007345 [Penicillium chermesinum]KAJ5226120.1 hypothetical protein N7468_007345 [Penicillium chermesinum]